ncbi:MAG: hypothetical protein LUQ38_02455 [Methanotrichaceae archaeon]|nr:hypothetical protein [Methanotrichaceae archaeon]
MKRRARQKDRFSVYFVVAVKYLEELVIAAMKCDLCERNSCILGPASIQS